MKEQYIKEQYIKALMASVLALVMPARLPAQSLPMTVDVPFTFHLADATLSSGTYIVRVQFGNVLKLLPIEGGGVCVLTTAVVAGETPAKGALEFRRYGNEYFLTKAFWKDNTYGRQLPNSKVEAQLARANSPGTVRVTTNR
jgi:hypothetical protein